MKILLILTIFSALISMTYTKTQEETAACVAALLSASISTTGTTDSTQCSDCIGKCATGDAAKQVFNGYTVDCVNKCDCPGVFAAVKTAAQTDNCKSAFKLISFAGIMLVLLMALLI